MQKKILLILLGIGLCFSLELVARLILSNSELSIMESINTVCHEDSELLWRQKKNLNTFFQSKCIKTNSLGLRNRKIAKQKREDSCRLICLGGSSTFGWGVDEDKTYAKRLQGFFKLDQINAEVINAGQIGYTSYQGKLFLEKYLLEYSPDIVTVSYVLNDIDKVRFFKSAKLSDRQIGLRRINKLDFKKFIIDKRIYFVLKRVALGVLQKNKKISTSIYRKQYEKSKIRVSPQEYKDNLQEIVSMCVLRNIKLVFIVMPINLSLPNIDAEGNASQLSNKYYIKAKEYERLKDYKNAELFFKKALDYQVFICNENGLRYQRSMIKIAQENKIPIVNAAKLFKTYMNNNGTDLFNGTYDRIHPNALGHKIIAKALYDLIIDNNLLPFRKTVNGK